MNTQTEVNKPGIIKIFCSKCGKEKGADYILMEGYPYPTVCNDCREKEYEKK